MLLSADSFANVGEDIDQSPGSTSTSTTKTGGSSDNIDRKVEIQPDGTIHNADGSIEHVDGTIVRESDAQRNSNVGNQPDNIEDLSMV